DEDPEVEDRDEPDRRPEGQVHRAPDQGHDEHHAGDRDEQELPSSEILVVARVGADRHEPLADRGHDTRLPVRHSPPPPPTHQPLAVRSAPSRSAHRSSTASSPTDRRQSVGLTTAASPAYRARRSMSVSTPPRLVACVSSRSPARNASVSSTVPLTSN